MKTILLIMMLSNNPDPWLAMEVASGIAIASEVFDIDPDWLIAVGHVESKYETHDVSSAGCCGVFQMKPDKYGRRSCEWYQDHPGLSAIWAAKHLNWCRYQCKVQMGKQCTDVNIFMCYNSPPLGLKPCVAQCGYGWKVLRTLNVIKSIKEATE